MGIHAETKKGSFVHSRIDEDVKEKASFILDEIGLSVSDAIRLFLKQVIMKRGMPFPVRIPNAHTIAAMTASDKEEGMEEVTLSQLRKQFQSERKKITQRKKKV
jgi:DNA-damage-inducible protein J